MFNPTEKDREQVALLLGRFPDSDFEVVLRGENGFPVVIKNSPFLKDMTPMPTLFWLVGKREREAVSRLESWGYIKIINDTFPPEIIAEDHLTYAKLRDELIPQNHTGPRPEGGVGGTRRGVKCLHAHLAAYLAGEGDRVGRYCAKLLAKELYAPVAAIDCGSNSTRLLILGPDKEVLLRQMRITRLGEGVDRSGYLSETAMARGLEVLKEFRSDLDKFAVSQVRAIATSAVRDAMNGKGFASRAADMLDCDFEILSGEEEARLAYKGATLDLDQRKGPYLLADIGGGSTEIVLGEMGEVLSLTSLNMGCVRITERFSLTAESLPDSGSAGECSSSLTEAVAQAGGYIKGLLEATAREIPMFSQAKVMVGVAGTVSALARIDLGIASHDETKTHHHLLRKDFIKRIADLLPGLSTEERVERLSIEEGRADVILGGVLILEQLMDVFQHDEMLVSEKDILDAAALSLFEK